jgi:hypothetical protein
MSPLCSSPIQLGTCTDIIVLKEMRQFRKTTVSACHSRKNVLKAQCSKLATHKNCGPNAMVIEK